MYMELNLTTYILPHYFFAALLVGILYCLWVKPDPVVIIKHPTPFNTDDVIYKDGQHNCYKYKVVRTHCPADSEHKMHRYNFVDQ